VRALSLLYHDVVVRHAADESGFPGAGASVYKLEPAEFERHLAAIARGVPGHPALVSRLTDGAAASAPFLLTFDDGGRSAFACIADLLERFEWRGHFFITTAYIGAPGFLTAQEIRALDARGHVIGSHSHSHPTRMSRCSAAELLTEWERSTRILAHLLGKPVSCASVPGGYYADKVAATAAAAGIRALFTSEPTARCREVDGCLVLGRYSIRRGTPAATAAAYAAGRVLPRVRQQWFWNCKKVAKALGGEMYLAVRRAVYARLAAHRDRAIQRLTP